MLNPTGEILRLIDANANRAREALRVLEDYTRFVLDSSELSQGLKMIRHDLTQILKPWLADAILHRDTPGDVGVTNKAAAEAVREDLSEVITASGKRLGESLRALEEYLKTVAPREASRIETLRYHFYDLELQIARTLRPSGRFHAVRLYVLITESACKHPWLETAEQAILGGADCLQLREKTLDTAEFLSRVRLLLALCRRHGVLCIINDRLDVAVASGADGLHLGQGDLPAIEARKLLGSRMILGISTHTLEQARQAVLDGADYIGVGPIFKSTTKPRDFVAGLEYAAAVRDLAIPKVAIAGIGSENVDKVLKTGIKAVAVTASVTGSEDVAGAARALKAKLIA